MATSVTYKDSQITSFANGTRVLKTAGKYMEDDVTIVTETGDASAITIVDEQDSHGGIIRHINAVTLTGDTITADVLLSGYTAHDGTGQAITGTYIPSGGGGGTYQAKTNINPSTSSQTITPDAGYDALSSVQINAMPSGTAGTPTATKGTVSNHSVLITPSVTNTTGYITGSTKTGTAVTVNASELVSGKKEITANGDNIDVANYATVKVAISSSEPVLQDKTNVTPTESSQTITADAGYDALSSVQINAISSTYVGSGITSRSSSDLTASGATVTVPAGYYSAQATKSVSSMTLPTSAAASATSGYTSKATISRSTSDQYINIPPGYNSTGAYYTISAIANGSATGPSSLSGTSATISTGTNTITLTKTGVTTTPTVSAGYVSSATASTATVTLTASVTTKAAATITPGTTNQTIASGTYLTGTQTISGDANLVASNIISGKSIFGVSGSVVIQHYYTGSSTPSSSLGVNGDVYLQTS